MTLHSLPIKSNDVRLPDPQPGEALVVERYSAKHVKAVIPRSDAEQHRIRAELLERDVHADFIVAAREPAARHLLPPGLHEHHFAESHEVWVALRAGSVERPLHWETVYTIDFPLRCTTLPPSA